MSSLSRFGPRVARSAALLGHHQHVSARQTMATSAAAVNSDPIQKLFVDKIKEFKATNKGLDEAHKKAMSEEMNRLKRVYHVEDENKLAQLDYKFTNEHQVSLHDIDESRELRSKIASGEYKNQLVFKTAKPSPLLASTPEQVTRDLQLPPMNKPDPVIIMQSDKVPSAPTVGEIKPDYEFVGEKMTPSQLERDLNVKFGPEMPTINDDKKPERDLVNFPRIPQLVDTPPTRFHFIPESWFQFFHPKTGVTGPYIFAFSLTTFLFSKEWLIMEHEMLTAFTSATAFTIAVIKFGPKVSAALRNMAQQEYDDWDAWQHGHIDLMNKMQTHYKNELEKKAVLNDLYEIRKQDIDMQLEGEYRNRLKTIYTDTKRRLDYLVSVADSQRLIAYKNMVNWVISNAVASFGVKQEAEVLDNCIGNLKHLATKHANSI